MLRCVQSEVIALPAKMDTIASMLPGARSGTPVRPCPTVQPAASDAPTPRPRPPAKCLLALAAETFEAVTGPLLRAATKAPTGMPSTNSTSQLIKRLTGSVSRVTVPGTTAIPKSRAARLDRGHATIPTIPMAIPVRRQDHAPA